MSDIKDPRVLFAAERTLLAWNRTSLALVAFGFLVERAGLLISILAPERTQHAVLSFWLGLAFIALGAVSAVYSAQQYAIVLKNLTAAEFPPGYTASWGIAVNIVIALLSGALIVALYAGR